MKSAATCKLGKKHKWVWVKNISVTKGGPRSFRSTLHGMYHCACGDRRVGKYNHDGGDLRTIGQFAPLIAGNGV